MTDNTPTENLVTTIEHYRVVSVLGSGGMGKVCLAEDPRAGNRKVAIKTVEISEHLSSSQKESLRQRLRQEAHALGRVVHSCIPTLYHVIEKESAFYIVMEYIEGKPLSDLLRERVVLTQGRIVQMGISVLSALAVAHAEGLVHRDIKPSNIMVMPDGMVKLIDFGLAKDLDFDAELTRSNSSPGTPGYMAPEQVAGQDTTKSSDLFCVGIVLYELLTGQTPFRGKTSAERCYSILYEQPPDVRMINPTIPEAIGAAVMRALAKDPNDRFPDAAAMIEVLKAMPESASGLTVMPSGVQVAMYRKRTSGRPKRKPEVRRLPLRTLLIALAAASAVVAAVVFFLTGPRGGTLEQKSPGPRRPSTAESADPQWRQATPTLSEGSSGQPVAVPPEEHKSKPAGDADEAGVSVPKPADDPDIGRQRAALEALEIEAEKRGIRLVDIGDTKPDDASLASWGMTAAEFVAFRSHVGQGDGALARLDYAKAVDEYEKAGALLRNSDPVRKKAEYTELRSGVNAELLETYFPGGLEGIDKQASQSACDYTVLKKQLGDLLRDAEQANEKARGEVEGTDANRGARQAFEELCEQASRESLLPEGIEGHASAAREYEQKTLYKPALERYTAGVALLRAVFDLRDARAEYARVRREWEATVRNYAPESLAAYDAEVARAPDATECARVTNDLLKLAMAAKEFEDKRNAQKECEVLLASADAVVVRYFFEGEFDSIKRRFAESSGREDYISAANDLRSLLDRTQSRIADDVVDAEMANVLKKVFDGNHPDAVKRMTSLCSMWIDRRRHDWANLLTFVGRLRIDNPVFSESYRETLSNLEAQVEEYRGQEESWRKTRNELEKAESLEGKLALVRDFLRSNRASIYLPDAQAEEDRLTTEVKRRNKALPANR